MSLLPSEAAEWRRYVRVRQSARARHVRLRFMTTGGIELVVPKGISQREIEALLNHHEPWVLRQLSKPGVYLTPVEVMAPSEVTLTALAEQWTVEYLQDDGRHGCRSAGRQRLRVSGGDAWQPALKRWLARRARMALLPWLESVSREVGLPYSGVSVRGQRSRWGSCSASRHINLNYSLLFLKPELVRYLFIHELCHTRHMNHSARYWQMVESVEPGYREYDRALRRAMRDVPEWVHARAIAPVGS